MKKYLISFMMVCSVMLFSVSFAHADEMDETMKKSFCPKVTLHIADELGLSEEQKTRIQVIKDELWKQMKPVVDKASDDVKEVLTSKQEAKYRDLMASMGGGCGHGHKSEKCDKCDGKSESCKRQKK